MERGAFFSAAFSVGCEINIRGLAIVLGLEVNEHPFEVCLQVEKSLLEFGLEMSPALPKGDIDSPRLIFSRKAEITNEGLFVEIREGESATLEFKSSLLYDLARVRARPETHVSELRSDSVLFSSLKTIAAFLNSDGGRLLVGVEDSGDICGIAHDFQYCGGQGKDPWELNLRSLIESRFYDGRTINNFVSISFVRCDDHDVARISVTKRSAFCYLSSKTGDYELYVRQGNRTARMSLPDVEQMWRSRFRASQ